MTLDQCTVNLCVSYLSIIDVPSAKLSIFRQPKIQYVLPGGLAWLTLWNAYQRQCMIHLSAEEVILTPSPN